MFFMIKLLLSEEAIMRPNIIHTEGNLNLNLLNPNPVPLPFTNTSSVAVSIFLSCVIGNAKELTVLF